MAGIAVSIQYGPDGKPFMALDVDAGMTHTQIWVADKDTALHNVAEINRQLKAALQDLMGTPDKLIEVKGSIDGLHDKSGRVPAKDAPRRPPIRSGRSRP